MFPSLRFSFVVRENARSRRARSTRTLKRKMHHKKCRHCTRKYLRAKTTMRMATMRSMKTIVTRKNPNIYSQTLLSSSNKSISSSLGGRQLKAQQKQMEQKPADQRKVFLGVSVGLVVCAIPFLFKTIQKRELNVANMRDGNSSGFTGSSSSDSSNRDEKEDARKSRLSFRRKQS